MTRASAFAFFSPWRRLSVARSTARRASSPGEGVAGYASRAGGRPLGCVRAGQSGFFFPPACCSSSNTSGRWSSNVYVENARRRAAREQVRGRSAQHNRLNRWIDGAPSNGKNKGRRPEKGLTLITPLSELLICPFSAISRTYFNKSRPFFRKIYLLFNRQSIL